MPSVYTFTRSDQEILDRLLAVFNSGRGTAREQWSLQAEVLVEPIGWDALWKLSKDFCKKFEVRFPCIVLVSVTSVDYDMLTASVELLSVQHETVSLPESVDEVPLIELWPTTKQREACVNAATTAEFIDLLRFFYQNIWMPWDDQDDKVLLGCTVEERMQLWSDLHNGTIPHAAGRTITLLRSSAIAAHEKLKESSIIETDEDDPLIPPTLITLWAELSVKLDSIMSQWSLYENPLIREEYLAKENKKWELNKNRKNVVALWQGGSVFEFEEISKFLQVNMSTDQTLSIMVSAEEAFSLEPEHVVVCSKNYEIPEMPLSKISLSSLNGATLTANSLRSCLLITSEACTVRDVALSCARVNTVLLARPGDVALKHCALCDDQRGRDQAGRPTDFGQGIVAMAGSKVLLEDCTLENFYTGIVVHKGAQVELRNCKIEKCGVGVQLYSGGSVSLVGTRVVGCTEQNIRCELDPPAPNDVSQVQELRIDSSSIIGTGNLQKEVLIVAQEDL